MFKKIEIWILYLTILLSVLFAIGFGVLVRQELVGSTKAGWVSKTALILAEIPVNFKSLLLGDDDLAVEDRFPTLDGFNGTHNLDESYLLLSRYDGNLQEGVVELVDLKTFEVLHTWNPDIDSFNDLVEQNDERYNFYNDRIVKMSETYHNFDKYSIPEKQREVYKTIGGAPHLDQNYTVFGEVVEGFDVIDSIASSKTDSLDRPIIDVRILSVRVLE
jgi:hypothetical protein